MSASHGATATHGTPGSRGNVSAERITQLAGELERRLDLAISHIVNLNNETKIISLNAKMEAARAGGRTGNAFGVVAQSVQDVSCKTADVAKSLADQTHQIVTDLQWLNHELATRVRGERLSDLALMNIDVIDRNLYERSCDCRWWATDPSVVAALDNPTAINRAECGRRLGQILDSYTVYFDIVVADRNGIVIANGRPNLFRSVDTFHADKDWFRTALQSASGDQFSFRSVESSPLANGERTLTYSCSVREQGNIQGKTLGVLAVVFRWDALAQTIVKKTPLSAEERGQTRVCIVDQDGRVLADTTERFYETLELPNLGNILSSPKSHQIYQDGARIFCVGHASSPGYETYATGWHSLIIQDIQAA